MCSSREKGNWEGTSHVLFNDALSFETIECRMVEWLNELENILQWQWHTRGIIQAFAEAEENHEKSVIIASQQAETGHVLLYNYIKK